VFFLGSRDVGIGSLHPEFSPPPRTPHCKICHPTPLDSYTEDAHISLAHLPCFPPALKNHFRPFESLDRSQVTRCTFAAYKRDSLAFRHLSPWLFLLRIAR
jgi:hypothetical protein